MPEIRKDEAPKRAVVISFLLFLSLLSGGIVYWATVHGPLGYSDAVAYIVSARNLIKGLGLGMFTPAGRFVVTYLHPPLYPLLLSGVGIWGIDLVDAARWCNIILSILTVFTTGYLFIRHSRFPETAILAGTLTFFFPAILVMSVSAMSELLFLFLLGLSCLFLIGYLQDQTRNRFLVSALIYGLLPITRYVGVAFLIPAVVCLLLFSNGTLSQRLKNSFVFGLLTCLPLAIWLTILYFGSSLAFGGRNLQIDSEYLAAGFRTYQKVAVDILWNWIPFSQRSIFQFLHPLRGTVLILLFLAIGIITWLAVRRLAAKEERIKSNSDIQLTVFFGVGTVSYFLVFMGTWLFTVPQTPINDRLLMPVYFAAILGFLSWWSVLRGVWFQGNGFARLVPWLMAVLLVYWYFPQVTDTLQEARKNDTPLAYRWKDSQIIQAVKNLPEEQIIISNKSETIVLWADRPAYDLMEYLQPSFIKQTSAYGSDDTDTAQQIFRQGGALVVFSDFKNQFESTYGERGKERFPTLFDGLIIAGQSIDGTIYYYPSP